MICPGAVRWPCPSRQVAQEWLSGLGYNPAAPAKVLIRILDAGDPACLFRVNLPPGVLDAAVVHPIPKVRGRLVTQAVGPP